MKTLSAMNGLVSNCRRSLARGFTLVELVVIVAVVAVLLTLHVTATAGARGRSKVTVCAANVRQLTHALQLYAADNNNRLPVVSSSANWAWDMPWMMGYSLLNYGLEKRDFYCPGTTPRFTDAENFLNPGMQSLWGFGETAPSENGFHLVGYVFALSGSSSALIISNQNTTIVAETVRSASGQLMRASSSSERVLVADATISSTLGSYPLRYTYNYTDVVGGFSKAHTSPHLRGKFPAGGNLGFKDGHVGWRKFDEMDQRASRGMGFWW